MRTFPGLSVACCALTLATSASAQVTISPLSTFGGGDGWISATDSSTDYLTQGNFERGLGYNPVTKHLYFVSRETAIDAAVNVRILDSSTGADIGALDTTGITGGTFTLNKIVVGDDGLIYAANLRTGTTGAAGLASFKVYRWNSESSTPATVFDVLPDTGSRVGDDLDLIGSGASTRLVAGYGVSATAVNSNGYIVIDPTASLPTPTTPVFNNVAFPEGTGAGQTSDGDFRLGITFLSGGASGTVIGTQGGTAPQSSVARLTDYSGSTGTLRATLTLQVTNERVMEFATVGGVPLLATMETGGTAAAPLLTAGTVRLYDMTDPTAPVFLTSINNMTGSPFENSNFAGDLRWGQFDGNTATLYALNTNNGIQAFLVTVPEPSTIGLLGIGVLGMLNRRRRGI